MLAHISDPPMVSSASCLEWNKVQLVQVTHPEKQHKIRVSFGAKKATTKNY
ncbi:hypothetical protein RchiOBHm_Chr1g0315121 [Rosa chinensis]|uniref:Uncharacterized protein n=1 Tax=Rosa chinensis TaxID=74649 RepID=A0A2P6S7C9_ROSCH|nr:hypothetical protein RchiOBHm_Chr1g0315121 [Rosa chinensis]